MMGDPSSSLVTIMMENIEIFTEQNLIRQHKKAKNYIIKRASTPFKQLAFHYIKPSNNQIAMSDLIFQR